MRSEANATVTSKWSLLLWDRTVSHEVAMSILVECMSTVLTLLYSKCTEEFFKVKCNRGKKGDHLRSERDGYKFCDRG